MPGFNQTSDLSAWQALKAHHETLGRNIVLKEFFQADPNRSVNTSLPDFKRHPLIQPQSPL